MTPTLPLLRQRMAAIYRNRMSASPAIRAELLRGEAEKLVAIGNFDGAVELNRTAFELDGRPPNPAPLSERIGGSMNATLPMSPALERKPRALDEALLDRLDRHAEQLVQHCVALERDVSYGVLKDEVMVRHIYQGLSEARSIRETIATARRVI